MSNTETCFPVARTVEQQQRLQHDDARASQYAEIRFLPRYGHIVKVLQLTDSRTGQKAIRVLVRLDDIPSEVTQGSYKRLFPLGHFVEEIAVVYGDADNLVGRPCRLEQYGDRADQGVVYLDNPEGLGDLDSIIKMPAFSTILAPAGGGES